MCGRYVSYWDMYIASARNPYGQLPVAFRVTIQYDQLIMFKNYYEYINEIYGNLNLKLRISPDALVWRCIDPQYSLLYMVTSFLEHIPVVVGTSGNTNTKTIPYKVRILKECVDNHTIKSVNEVYTKRFTQLTSYERACNNVLTVSNGEVTLISNNIIALYSYDHTNVRLTCSNWKITRAETIVAGYNVCKRTNINCFEKHI
jgi:hypothetical protein